MAAGLFLPFFFYSAIAMLLHCKRFAIPMQANCSHLVDYVHKRTETAKFKEFARFYVMLLQCYCIAIAMLSLLVTCYLFTCIFFIFLFWFFFLFFLFKKIYFVPHAEN